MFKIYIIGICILLVAIVANVVAGKIGIMTWYDFGTDFFTKVIKAIKEAGILNCIWLFIGYPLVLGGAYIIGEKFYNLLA